MRPFAWTRDGVRRPLVLGHRGAPNEAPENTLPSFEAALSQGADGVELDVRVCATGDLVVFHDPTLARATHGSDARAVAALAWDELRRVDVDGARVPRLTDVLVFCRRAGLAVNVEMKRDVPNRRAVVQATARALRSWDPAHPVLVSSFDPPMLAAFRAAAPDVPVGLLVRRAWYTEIAAVVARSIGATAVHVERTAASPTFVRALHERGLAVAVWTVNDEREALDLAALRTDALITDRPAVIRATLDPRAAPPGYFEQSV